MQSPVGRFGVVPHAGTHDMGLVCQFQVGDIKITYLKPPGVVGAPAFARSQCFIYMK
jgi:hypothetical protein